MNKLLQNSVSRNTNNVYENAIALFEKFRFQYKIDQIWPPPFEQLVNFIAYLSKLGYSAKTARAYLSGINFKLKLNNWNDFSNSFILDKMLNGMQRLGKKMIQENQLLSIY